MTENSSDVKLTDIYLFTEYKQPNVGQSFDLSFQTNSAEGFVYTECGVFDWLNEGKKNYSIQRREKEISRTIGKKIN